MVAVENRAGDIAFHEVVGLSESVTGVQPEAPLGEWLHLALVDGLMVSSGEAAETKARKKYSDLQVLENGVETSDACSSTVEGSELRSSRGSKETRRKSWMGPTSSVESVRAQLANRYHARTMLAQKIVTDKMAELSIV